MPPLSKHHTRRYQRSVDDLRHDMWETVSSSLLKKRAVGALQRRISGTWSFSKDLLKRESMPVFEKVLDFGCTAAGHSSETASTRLAARARGQITSFVCVSLNFKSKCLRDSR